MLPDPAFLAYKLVKHSDTESFGLQDTCVLPFSVCWRRSLPVFVLYIPHSIVNPKLVGRHVIDILAVRKSFLGPTVPPSVLARIAEPSVKRACRAPPIETVSNTLLFELSSDEDLIGGTWHLGCY